MFQLSYLFFAKHAKNQYGPSICFLKQSFLQLKVSPPVRPYVHTSRLGLFFNLGMLELSCRSQTFRDYSFGSKVPGEKRSNSIINTVTSVRPF